LVDFLQNKADLYDFIGKSRTYFLLNKDAVIEKRLEIMAYFSVALQTLSLPIDISVRQIKKLDGLFGKKNGQKIETLPVYLIGQLAKNDLFQKNISGSFILENALSVIRNSYDGVGGRIVVVDCKPLPGLISFYESNGFHKIDYDEANGLAQMIFMLNEEEVNVLSRK
jgi:hypothetical protein